MHFKDFKHTEKYMVLVTEARLVMQEGLYNNEDYVLSQFENLHQTLRTSHTHAYHYLGLVPTQFLNRFYKLHTHMYCM